MGAQVYRKLQYFVPMPGKQKKDDSGKKARLELLKGISGPPCPGSSLPSWADRVRGRCDSAYHLCFHSLLLWEQVPDGLHPYTHQLWLCQGWHEELLMIQPTYQCQECMAPLAKLHKAGSSATSMTFKAPVLWGDTCDAGYGFYLHPSLEISSKTKWLVW